MGDELGGLYNNPDGDLTQDAEAPTSSFDLNAIHTNEIVCAFEPATHFCQKMFVPSEAHV